MTSYSAFRGCTVLDALSVGACWVRTLSQSTPSELALNGTRLTTGLRLEVAMDAREVQRAECVDAMLSHLVESCETNLDRAERVAALPPKGSLSGAPAGECLPVRPTARLPRRCDCPAPVLRHSPDRRVATVPVFEGEWQPALCCESR